MFTLQKQLLTMAALAVCMAVPVFAQGTVVIKTGTGTSTAQAQITTIGKTAAKTVDTTVVVDSTSLIATLTKAGNYNTFVQLLDSAGLTSTLRGTAKFTVFAPTDEAFAKIPQEKMDSLMADSVMLKKVLLYHVVNSAIPANKILSLKTARTFEGKRVSFKMTDGRLMVNDAVVIQPDLKASNGVIHGIDAVLMPK